MSKFFRALEKVEQERDIEARAGENADASGPRPPTQPRSVPASDGPGRDAVVTAPVTIAPMPAPVARAAAPATMEAVAPPPPVVTAAPEPGPSPFAKGPEGKATVYGAPIMRDAGGSRFAPSQLDLTPADEPGELDDHLVSLLEPTSFAAEQYRAIRLAIETFRQERGTRVVGISSPGRGDGKTMTAINVAGALAQASDARVVLLEVDLRHPAVARYLGLPAARGLSGYLLDSQMEIDRIIEQPAGIAFGVIPAGAASSMPYELLKSPRLSALFAELRQRFDYVVVDTPPVMPYPDVGILKDAVDGFVLVVRANRTPRELVRDATNVIGRQRTLGLVFNDDDRSGVATFADEADGGWRRYVPRPLGGARVA